MSCRHISDENENCEQLEEEDETYLESGEYNNSRPVKSTECRVDALLRHFLFMVLKEDCRERLELDDLQTKIEELQSRRYYLCQSTGDNNRTTGPGASASAVDTPQVDEQSAETRDMKVSQGDRGSEEEQKLVEQRDYILDGLFKTTTDAISPIAIDATMISERENFAKAIAETKQYPYNAYVCMCNKTLALLASVQHQAHPPFREPDPLNIRFHLIKSKPANGKMSNPKQSRRLFPRVVITSHFSVLREKGLQKEAKAGEDHSASASPSISETGLKWDAVLSAIEFKKKLKKCSLGGQQSEEETGKETPCPFPKSTQDVCESKRPREEEDGEDNASPKKKARQLHSGSRDTKEKTTSPNDTQAGPKNKPSQEMRDMPNGGTRCASYALEMLSYGVGVHHVVNILVIDSHCWIWYYDRQGTMQSDSFCILSNFSHFLILHFALQRFNLQDWGVVSCLNPEALRAHGLQSTEQDGENFTLDVRQNTSLWKSQVLDDALTSVKVNMSEALSLDLGCLAGRATAVVSAVGFAADGSRLPTPLVCKIAHPELQWRHEGATIHIVRQIAVDNDAVDMLKHLPALMFYGDIRGTFTHRIRSVVGLAWKGHRGLRIIVMKKLEKITTVQGAEFIKAWLDAVICHAFLWKHYVGHGDPSLSNIMYDPETKCGVLCDYDMSHLQWVPRVVGTEMGGTVPFMAIDLLVEEYWEGKIQRFYHHELESFIWILTYVSLLYKDGKRQPNPLVDPWRTSDYAQCRKEKTDFYHPYSLEQAGESVQLPYKDFWDLAKRLCETLHACHIEKFPANPARWIDIQHLSRSDPDTPQDDDYSDPQIFQSQPRWKSTLLWARFRETLSDFLASSPDNAHVLQCQLSRLALVRPSFQPPDKDTVERLCKTYSVISAQAPPVSEP